MEQMGAIIDAVLDAILGGTCGHGLPLGPEHGIAAPPAVAAAAGCSEDAVNLVPAGLRAPESRREPAKAAD
jgi:hypothetical protein